MNRFLRAYRNSPHGSTRVAPSQLIFIRSNSSKLPARIEEDLKKNELFEMAKLNDNKAKEAMKAYADSKRKAKQSRFSIGDKVLINQRAGKKLNNKTKTKFSSQVWTIKNMKGSMLTVEANGQEKTRNAFWFKLAPENMGEEIELEVLPSDKDDSLVALPNHESNPEPHSCSGSVALLPTNEVAVRRSERQRNPIVRFEAGPASGLKSR